VQSPSTGDEIPQRVGEVDHAHEPTNSSEVLASSTAAAVAEDDEPEIIFDIDDKP
jgi:hypothetical protein